MANVKKIIDVSTFNTISDYKQAAKNVDGVIIRCGVTLWGNFVPIEDKNFRKHFEGFKEAGLPIGVYYYGVANTVEKAKLEAKQCIDILNGLQFELPVYYDVEETNTQGDLSKKELTEIVDTFCSTLEEAGYFVGFYTMANWAENKLDYSYLAKKYSAWIAWLGTDPATRFKPAPAAWQHSWTASIPGIKGDCDQSKFYTDYASIIPAAGLNGYGKKTTITIEELKRMGITSITF